MGGDWTYALGERTAETPWLVPMKTPRTNFPASVTALIGHGWELGEGSALGDLAALADTLNNPGRAARLYGAAEALEETVGMPLQMYQGPKYEHYMEMGQKKLDAPTFTTAWAEGHAMALEQAVAYALENQGYERSTLPRFLGS